MSNAELFTSSPDIPNSIAIIGGGVASICLADQIFKQTPNAQVSIFCQDSELASRGSGNKQGAIYPLLQGSHSVIAEFYATSFDYAMAYYTDLLNEGLEVEHGFTGVLQQAIKPELESRLEKVAQTWPQHCEYLSAQQSSEIAGIELPYPSIYFQSAGWIWPQQFCQQLASKLQQNFALDVQLNTNVEKLQYKEQWNLSNSDSQLGQFDAFIICAGHQTNRYPQTSHIPLQSVRGQVSRFHSKTALSGLKTVLCHKGYITPAQSEYQCFGATFVKDSDNEEVRQSEQQTNLQQLKKVYSEQDWSSPLSEDDIIANKAAIRAMSPDHIPIVGEVFSDNWIRQNVDKNTGRLIRLKDKDATYPDSDLKHLYTMTALGARGLTSAPLLAKHLTAQLFNVESPFNERMQKAISTKRFQVKQLKQLKNNF